MAFKRYRRFGARSFRKRARHYRRRRYYRRFRGAKRVGRYRRFPRSTETKIAQFLGGAVWQFQSQDSALASASFPPMHACCIPKTPDATQLGVAIANGTDNQTRIGSKIKPIKLRFSGAVSYTRQAPSSAGSHTYNYAPAAFALRVVIYQVRGGNGSSSTGDAAFHPMAIVTDATGSATGLQARKIFGTYYCGSNGLDQTADDLRRNIMVSKGPLRLGIGGQMRMLYNKTYTMQTGGRTSIPFRIVTKIPRRFVWAEQPNGAGGVATQTTCRNPVYATFTLVPLTAQPEGDVILDYQCDCFFIDK